MVCTQQTDATVIPADEPQIDVNCVHKEQPKLKIKRDLSEIGKHNFIISQHCSTAEIPHSMSLFTLPKAHAPMQFSLRLGQAVNLIPAKIHVLIYLLKLTIMHIK